MHNSSPSSAIDQPRWTEAVDAALRAVEGLSDRAGALQLGISPGTLNRWRSMRAADEPIPEPRGAPRKALDRFIERPIEKTRAEDRSLVVRERVRNGEEPIAVADRGQRQVSADLIALGEPGQNQVRKRELLEGYRAYQVAAGRPLLDWWYELKRRVEAGEI